PPFHYSQSCFRCEVEWRSSSGRWDVPARVASWSTVLPAPCHADRGGPLHETQETACRVLPEPLTPPTPPSGGPPPDAGPSWGVRPRWGPPRWVTPSGCLPRTQAFPPPEAPGSPTLSLSA